MRVTSELDPAIPADTARLLEELLHPALRRSASYTLTHANGQTLDGTDMPRLIRSSLESARVQQAFTVVVSAQAISNGTTQRELASALGFSSAGNFAKDQLWSQMTDIATAITDARNAGYSTVEQITVRVPTRRNVYQRYDFHDVPTGL